MVGPKCASRAVIAGADVLQGPQRRHQRMLGQADLGADRRKVDVADLGFAGDLVGRGLRDDAERLRQRERGLVVIPLLDPVLVVEDGAELVGAPHVPEQDQSKTLVGMDALPVAQVAGPQMLAYGAAADP